MSLEKINLRANLHISLSISLLAKCKKCKKCRMSAAGADAADGRVRRAGVVDVASRSIEMRFEINKDSDDVAHD